jgi:hypothetical protein
MKEIIVCDTIGLCDTEWKESEVIDLIKDRVSANVSTSTRSLWFCTAAA